MVKRGLFVGRFQPFHLGHLGAIEDVIKEVEELVIVIGSAQYSHNLEDPFTAGERLVMVRTALEEAGIDCRQVWIVLLPDVELHSMWVSALKGYTPKFDVVYSNEPLTRRLFTEAGCKVKSIRFHNRKIHSSTEIRKRMINGENWQKLVPKSVAELIKEIDGVNRLRDLNKSDRL
jgi:nicotinamide-nucleotide adenylyltransferase